MANLPNPQLTEFDKTHIINLCRNKLSFTPDGITLLAGAGSNRRYYRVDKNDGVPVVATYGNDKKENSAFINLSRHFAGQCNLSVPEILAVSEDNMLYLQTWVGNQSLYERLASARDSGNYSDTDIALIKDAVKLLAKIQFIGGKNLDYTICYPQERMDFRLVRWDLNYFKYCFLKSSGLEFDEYLLQDEFDRLEKILLVNENNWPTFMLRDYQSRNLMVNEDNKLTAIDFQGGRRGPAAYDVASFLWQAKARYSEKLRQQLIDTYIDEAKSISPTFDDEHFRKELPYFVLFRCLQTLGAYGFRGWVERKSHFLQSVPAGVTNLFTLLDNSHLTHEFPTLANIAVKLYTRYASNPDVINNKYHHYISAATNLLTVRITSFSFKKGIPDDPSGNGGGFVFDCRAPHNPGRYEPFKQLTGLDYPVRDFLENDGEIKPFIEACEKIVDSSVERYIQRGFTNLSLNFGCTGGQHRSVYSADRVARHLNDKYGVRVVVIHREQKINMELPPKTVEVIFDSFLKDYQKPYDPNVTLNNLSK